jgi:uncharacterized repeat protein (TIGR03806 family)
VRSLGLLLAALSIAACGGGTMMRSPPCTPGGDGSYVDAPFTKLSEYCLVKLDGDQIAPLAGIPYDIITPLFSDYATKVRTVWIPKGSATYTASVAFSFPTGTIFTKSFGFKDDLRDPNGAVTWIETRLLVRTATTWKGYTYKWSADHSEASLLYAGTIDRRTLIDTDGATVQLDYLVPNLNQCKECHANGGVTNVIGPKARYLNKTYAYASGEENQLARWTKQGYLAGAPDPALVPKLAAWDDQSVGTATRARAYLEVNCAHCHNGFGTAGPSGLILWASETDPVHYGACKSPAAAGRGSGGFLFDVSPGDPDRSILVYRMTSTELSVLMPPISRSVVHKEGVALVRAWIAGLPGRCN